MMWPTIVALFNVTITFADVDFLAVLRKEIK